MQKSKPSVTPDTAHAGAGENSPASPDLRTRPLQEDIAACARELWKKYGCPVGRDEQIWLEAERQLLGTDPKVARVGGPTSADALNQASPPSTASSAGKTSKSKQPAISDEHEVAVSPSPASSGRRNY
jgi:hypothetical protein